MLVPPFFLFAGRRRVPRVGSNALVSAATGALIRGGYPDLKAVAGTSITNNKSARWAGNKTLRQEKIEKAKKAK